MPKNINQFLVPFVLGFGSALLIMALFQHKGGGTPSLETPISPGRAERMTTDRQHVSQSHFVSRSQHQWHDMDSAQTRQAESVFWQAMSIVQHKLSGDNIDPTEFDTARNVVDHLSDAELEEIIRSYTRLAPHDYPEQVEIHDFAKRLGELYYRDPAEMGESPLDSPENAIPIDFDSQINRSNMVKEPQESFATFTRRIYASFDTSNYKKNSVMVKWSRVDSPEVMIYDKYRLNSAMDYNYIWLEQPDGWQQGDYQVEIFSLEDNLSLLARGGYHVTD